jgi:hypothetical protein
MISNFILSFPSHFPSFFPFPLPQLLIAPPISFFFLLSSGYSREPCIAFFPSIVDRAKVICAFEPIQIVVRTLKKRPNVVRKCSLNRGRRMEVMRIDKFLEIVGAGLRLLVPGFSAASVEKLMLGGPLCPSFAFRLRLLWIPTGLFFLRHVYGTVIIVATGPIERCVLYFFFELVDGDFHLFFLC